MNIPIYRAKKIDIDEWVEGDLISYPDNKLSIRTLNYGCVYDVESVSPNTLAIHFPNMIDKNGNKIFASLSEDGVGGDNYKNGNIITTAKVTHGNAITPPFYFNMSELEVVGIHKG